MEQNTTESWGKFTPNKLQEWAIEQSNVRPSSLWGSFCRKLVLSGLQHPLDVRLWGANFRLYPNDNLCEKRALLSRAKFDVQERQALSERMHRDFKFVDVGANIGLYSLFVAMHQDFEGQILAIEPQPVIKERLRFNLLSNPGATVVHADCAVSDKKGVARMAVSRRNRGASGFHLRSDKEPDEEVMVQTLPLAEVLNRHNMNGADALKIDIEGAEDQVLPLFFEQTPAEDMPKLLILERNETWDTDCIALAKSIGYQQITQAHMNVVLEKT